jgi:type II secretory pathway pseudopilin PulG
MRSESEQRGFSLIGLLCTLSMFGLIGLLMVRGGPGIIEYWAINKAVSAARLVSKTPAEIRVTFDKLAAAGYIDTIDGKDLSITGTGDNMQVSFAYQKKIPLLGPASLVIDYHGSTATDTTEKDTAH